jgi:hypothetical protein
MRGKLSLVGFALTLLPQTLSACAVCFGQRDSRMADGLNMGVLSLFAVVALVLGGFVAFFIFLARRSAAMTRAGESEPTSQPNP